MVLVIIHGKNYFIFLLKLVLPAQTQQFQVVYLAILQKIVIKVVVIAYAIVGIMMLQIMSNVAPVIIHGKIFYYILVLS